jgi:hypothetical protein
VRARLLLLLVALAALTLVPSSSLADGDPASDVLLASTIYTPVAQKISPPVLQQLQRTLVQADAAGFRVRVALILDRTDLGAVPQLYGHPAKYVKLLAAELYYAWKDTVIAVQPSGIGVQNIEPLAPAQKLADSIHVARPATADALAGAADTAIRRLAAQKGVRLDASGGSSSGASAGRGHRSTTPYVIGALVIAILAVALAVQLNRRMKRARRPL